MDAIGDYVLFRNCLHHLKRNSVYSNYKFILLGNEAFKSLAIHYDSEVIDEFIWLKPSSLTKFDTIKRLRLIFLLKSKCFDVLINPVHSRVPSVDILVNEAGAKLKIGSKGDDINYSSDKEYRKWNATYDYLVDVPGTDYFEFDRNVMFVKYFLKERFRLDPIPYGFDYSNKDNRSTENLRIVIFPGASSKKKRWNPHRFAALMVLMLDYNREIDFVIAGGDDDYEIANKIICNMPVGVKIDNVTGKTDLPQLVDLIRNADLLISNDTSAMHIAVSVGTYAICISHGERFGRFSPYPIEISHRTKTVYPLEIFYTEDKEERKIIVSKYKNGSNLNIDLIDPLDVYKAAISLLTQ